MRRLPFDKLDFSIEDRPENCSTLFLLNSKYGITQVDNPLNPKLLIVSYSSPTPPMYFLHGKADRLLTVRRFLQTLKNPADLVIPGPMLPIITRYWPVQFSVPVLFLAGSPDRWQPQSGDNQRIRFLVSEDAPVLRNTFFDHPWLWEFFFNAENLLLEGQAVAAFVDGEMACVATTLAFTDHYCEIGVATRPCFRGRGLAFECSRALSKMQFERYHRLPCWRTRYDNIASRKVARELGLTELDYSDKSIFISNYQHIGAYATVAP